MTTCSVTDFQLTEAIHSVQRYLENNQAQFPDLQLQEDHIIILNIIRRYYLKKLTTNVDRGRNIGAFVCNDFYFLVRGVINEMRKLKAKAVFTEVDMHTVKIAVNNGMYAHNIANEIDITEYQNLAMVLNINPAIDADDFENAFMTINPNGTLITMMYEEFENDMRTHSNIIVSHSYRMILRLMWINHLLGFSIDALM